MRKARRARKARPVPKAGRVCKAPVHKPFHMARDTRGGAHKAGAPDGRSKRKASGRHRQAGRQVSRVALGLGTVLHADGAHLRS